MKWIVSASTRDASPEAVEIPWSRQVVPDQLTAERICLARNRAELECSGGYVWGYYEQDPSEQDRLAVERDHITEGEIATMPPYDC